MSDVKRLKVEHMSSQALQTLEVPVIELNDLEERLFSLLLDTASRLKKDTTLRVAGGWVRDKLLGRNSDDIDVALDNVSGAAFAEAVNDLMKELGMETHTIGVIEANPEQSKHLETAKLLVLGVWVDFTNLRTETYQSDSRIPTVAFGRADEDAHRRDFTINSLFYNLNNRTVEDLTGRGLSDLLMEHLIRTPLDSQTTFLDDPLRMLRAIRFAARFDYRLHADIVSTARQADLVQSLAIKVSRERVGIELEGMLSGKDARPQVSLGLISELGLADTVFSRPAETLKEGDEGMDSKLGETWDRAGVAVVTALATMLLRRLKIVSQNDDPTTVASSPTFRHPLPGYRLHFLSAMLLPWAGVQYVDEKKKRQPVSVFIVREALKFRTKDATHVTTILGLCSRFRSIAMVGRQASRVEVGMLLKEAQDLWRVALDMACVWELCTLQTIAQGEEGWLAIERRYNDMERHITELNLDECWKLKPMLNGQVIMKLVGVPQGPMMARAMQEQYRWQLEQPTGVQSELVEHMKKWLGSVST